MKGVAWAASNPPAKMVNLLKKALKGGTPVTARTATAKQIPIRGVCFITPRREGIMRVPVVKLSAPATRKNRLLAKEWLKMCSTAPLKASCEPRMEMDSARKTYESCVIVEYASSLFRS